MQELGQSPAQGRVLDWELLQEVSPPVFSKRRVLGFRVDAHLPGRVQ